MENIIRFYKENEFIDFIKEKSMFSKIYIAGAGSYGKLIGSYLDRKKIKWDGYIDKDPNKNIISNKVVYKYIKSIVKDSFVIISTNTLIAPIYNDLINIGYDDSQICCVLSKVYMINNIAVDNRILQYKNKYLKKRCFIIGNGPSLRLDDLKKIKNEVSFGCNGIFGVFNNTDWRPNFYCVLDGMMIEYLHTNKTIIPSECVKFSLKYDMVGYSFADEYICCEAIDDIDKYGLPVFSDDCLKYVCTSGTVMYFMLQLAVYMGFKEIILLGVDFRFSYEEHLDGSVDKYNVKDHMDLIDSVIPSGQKDTEIYNRIKYIRGHSNPAEIDKHYAGFSAAKKYADAHDIRIINSSRETKLDLFDRVDLDEYLKGNWINECDNNGSWCGQ